MKKISNVSASGIFFPDRGDGLFDEVFIEFKDAGYPVKVFENHLCCIGGNWIGQAARSDLNPKATFLREVGEELSFSKPLMSSKELVLLGQVDDIVQHQAAATLREPSDSDLQRLSVLKSAIFKRARYYDRNLVTVPADVFQLKDPNYSKGDVLTLNFFFYVPLPTDVWSDLKDLQRSFGNLSNESQSAIVTVDDLVAGKIPCSWGYDQILRSFFYDLLGSNAGRMPCKEGITVEPERGGSELIDYGQCRQLYNIARHPFV